VAVAIQKSSILSVEASLLGNHILERYARRAVNSLSPADVAGCFLIAAKYEDGLIGTDGDKLASAAHVKVEDMHRSERVVCVALEFDFCWTNPVHFLRWFSHEADGWNNATRRVAKAFLLAFTFDSGDLSTSPSLKAAAAMQCAKKVLKSGSWTAYHVAVTRWDKNEIAKVSAQMLKVLQEALLSGNLPFADLLTKGEVAQILCSGSDRSKGW